MPTLPHYEEHDPSNEKVVDLLDKFLAECEENDEDYDAEDVEELRNTEWQLKRFLLNNYMDVDRAHQQLCKFMKWKKEIGLRYVEDHHFPSEFYSLGALFTYSKDKQGNPALYIRVKYVKRVPEIMDVLKLFFIYHMKKADDESQGWGWVLIFDFRGATITNCDLEFVNFLITTMCEYFPCGVDYILTYELPWILNAVWKLIRACIPDHSKSLVKCADRKSIREFIDEENLPDFMGGTSTRSYTTVPSGCPTTEEYGEKVLGLNGHQVNKLMGKFKPLLSC